MKNRNRNNYNNSKKAELGKYLYSGANTRGITLNITQ